jgi:acyl-coenzyme A thioesterase PaaI-like protein
MCGHPSIQHGGASATIVDNNSGILAMLYSLDIVATAELKLKYLLPIREGQLYICKGSVTSREGRRILINSTIHEL